MNINTDYWRVSDSTPDTLIVEPLHDHEQQRFPTVVHFGRLVEDMKQSGYALLSAIPDVSVAFRQDVTDCALIFERVE